MPKCAKYDKELKEGAENKRGIEGEIFLALIGVSIIIIGFWDLIELTKLAALGITITFRMFLSCLITISIGATEIAVAWLIYKMLTGDF